MDLLGTLKQGFSKAVQMATDNQISVYSEFPECSLLDNTDRLSIKLTDPTLHHALLNQWRPETAEFNSIAFAIRDEDNRKRTVLTAHVQSGNGLLVKDMNGRAIMLVRPPQHSVDSIGKLMHPAPASLYKVMRVPMTMNYQAVRTPSGEPIFRIEKVLVSLYPLGKAMGLLGTTCVYLMKRLDGVVLGYVRPKLVMKSNTLVVKFTTNQRNLQVREALLGVALLFMISEVYPSINAILAESMRRKDTEI